LTDEIDTKSIEREKSDDEHCKEDKEERAMQETMQKARLSGQDASGIENISDFIEKVMPTQMN
jgi:hypothetical protein